MCRRGKLGISWQRPGREKAGKRPGKGRGIRISRGRVTEGANAFRCMWPSTGWRDGVCCPGAAVAVSRGGGGEGVAASRASGVGRSLAAIERRPFLSPSLFAPLHLCLLSSPAPVSPDRQSTTDWRVTLPDNNIREPRWRSHRSNKRLSYQRLGVTAFPIAIRIQLITDQRNARHVHIAHPTMQIPLLILRTDFRRTFVIARLLDVAGQEI
jgi:hypothetical protein